MGYSHIKDRKERFWAKVAVGAEEGCWPFMGFRDRRGYGRFSMGDASPESAHRVAFFFIYGRWPEQVNHKCDNPPCCNPNHLYEGTQSQNIQDSWNRNRKILGGD